VTLILASASPRRLALLAQIGITPGSVAPTALDETPLPGEAPRDLARRLAAQKAKAAAREGAITLAADTVVACGRRILPQAQTAPEARACLELLSGHAHCVMTGVCVIDAEGKARARLVSTRVIFKRLSAADIAHYLDSLEWQGKAGGYAIQGAAGRFVLSLNGSYSAVVGLPLYETAALLEGAGISPWRR
jgi:septum formation protein